MSKDRAISGEITTFQTAGVWIAALVAGTLAITSGCESGSGSSSTTIGDDTATPTTSAAPQGDFARTFDIGGREMYMECAGQGSPTVILVSGGGIAGDVWDSPLGKQPTVFPTVAEQTRTCVYDRPGTTRAVAEGGISRSDPVAQPVVPSAAVADLHALLEVSGETGPVVLAAHSFGGLVARSYANRYPDDVVGMVLIDSFSPELRDSMGENWPAWMRWNAPADAIIADYPDYERVDFDKALDEVDANKAIKPMPMVVLTADAPYPAVQIPGVPADMNVITRNAQDTSQREVAQLVPGAKHVTETHSGHDIMLENPVLVSDSVLEVVDAVRDNKTSLLAPASAALSTTPEDMTPVAAGTMTDAVLTPVIQSVLSPPRWYPGDDGRFHLHYELMLTNTVPLAVDVTSVEVLGDGQPIEMLSGDELGAAMTLLGSETGSTTELPASTVGIVWVDLSFESKDQIPEQVSHRLTVDVGPGLPVGPTITDAGAPAQVSPQQAVVVAPPLLGGRWVAVGGAAGPHRRAVQAVNGHLRLSQRFAVDFAALLDSEGRSHTEDADQNSSYFNYGQPVLAVGAGTVVEAVDGLPDQTPNHHSPIPPAEWGGNEVILRLDTGIYVGYGHFQPGSLRVRPGQHVRTGEVLGHLGNSGNSTGPHLHLQVMTRPSFLDADGLPFIIRGFRFDGSVPSLDALLEADTAGTPMPIDAAHAGDRRLQGITGLDVVTFQTG
jgi:pimeloyl-ACP methyl ester carboxylesterase